MDSVYTILRRMLKQGYLMTDFTKTIDIKNQKRKMEGKGKALKKNYDRGNGDHT